MPHDAVGPGVDDPMIVLARHASRTTACPDECAPTRRRRYRPAPRRAASSPPTRAAARTGHRSSGTAKLHEHQHGARQSSANDTSALARTGGRFAALLAHSAAATQETSQSSHIAAEAEADDQVGRVSVAVRYPWIPLAAYRKGPQHGGPRGLCVESSERQRFRLLHAGQRRDLLELLVVDLAVDREQRDGIAPRRRRARG